MEILKIIDKLKSKRKVFYSESDFQFALAWEIQTYYPNAYIRLEYPLNKEYMDIRVELDNKIYPIELKYKTKSLTVEDNDETYCLKNQGAQDIGRYDYLKDVQRIEQFLKEKDYECGYAILLTNDKLYWSENKRENNIDAQFCLNDGVEKTGKLKWSEKTGEGTKKGRENGIILKGKYKINWNEYSNFGKKNDEFKYCLNVIKKS